MSTKIGLGIPVPQMLPVTGTWTVPFAAYLVFLSNRVVFQRLSNKVYMGAKSNSSTTTDPKDDPIYVSSRCHLNFIENVPLALLFAAIVEVNGANRKYLNYALAGLFALRVAHAELGLMQKDAMGPGRIVGYYGTQAWLAGVAGWGAWLVREYWQV